MMIREPEVGDVYTTTYDNTLQIKFIDSEVVLFVTDEKRRQGGFTHRIETREEFNEMRDGGRMEYQPEIEKDITEPEKYDWSEVSYVGNKLCERLYEEGYVSPKDIESASQEELEEIPGLGNTALENLKEYADQEL